MEFLIYILIGWGVTDILVNGSILNPLRNYILVRIPFLYKLFSCIQCSGFWVGILLGFLSVINITTTPLQNYHWFAQILGSGFLISGISVVINSIIFNLLSTRPKKILSDSDEEN